MYWLVSPLIAALWDLKTGDIPDWLTIPGIVVTLFYGIFVPKILVPFILFGAIGYLMYRYGKIGGGDVLLLLSILPFYWNLAEPWFLSPLVVLAVALALTPFIYGLYLKGRENPLFLLPVVLLPPVFSLLYGILLFALVDKSRFEKEVSVDELKEEDVLARPVKGFNKLVIERGDREILKEMGIERVVIYHGLPKMGPAIFITLLWFVLRPPMEILVTPPALILYLL